MARTITVERDFLTLDLLLWRAYGRSGNTSAMLALAHRLNPGLAAKGAVLPMGTVVRLPEMPSTASAPSRRVVNLFDD